MQNNNTDFTEGVASLEGGFCRGAPLYWVIEILIGSLINVKIIKITRQIRYMIIATSDVTINMN